MQRSTFFLLVALFAIGLAFMLNLVSIFWLEKPETFLHYNDVRGMAVVHANLPYTLNFEQQNQVIDLINRALPVGPHFLSNKGSPPDFEKLIIYRFKTSDLELHPVAYVDDHLVFSVPEWDTGRYLQEVSQGSMHHLLSQTYDE